MHGGIPQPTFQAGSFFEEFFLASLGGSLDDLQEIEHNAGITRIQAARDRILRRLTIGNGVRGVPSLVNCTSEQERQLVQALAAAVDSLTRELCKDLNREGGRPTPPDIMVGG